MIRKYTEEQKEFIRCNCLGVDSKELTARINNHFGTSFTVGQITSLRYSLNCLSGITNHGKHFSKATEFKPGNKSWNKGTKGLMKANRTSFKPGQKPHNVHPIGKIMMRHDGYIYIKLEETKPSRFGWKALHIYNWENKNGKLPPGIKLLFLDGDHTNCDVSNLLPVTSGQMVTINKFRLTGNDPDITRAGVTLASLISKTHKRQQDIMRNKRP